MNEKLLLHICCYPCFYASEEILKSGKFKIEGFFFNPNIEPYKEYEKRRNVLYEKKPVEIFYADYPLKDYLREILNYEDRCYGCYKFRFAGLLNYAVENNYRIVSSTLLSSPYQKHNMIADILDKLSAEKKIKFFNFGVNPGYKDKMNELWREEIYLQNYCGCIFSEYERFNKKK